MILANIPDFPSVSVGAQIAAASVCAVAGCLLLVAGRTIGRFVLGLAAGAIAWRLAPMLGPYVRIDQPILLSLSASVSAALLVFVLARLIWALLLGGGLGAAGLWIVVTRFATAMPHPRMPTGRATEVGQWLQTAGRHLLDYLPALWSHNWLITLLAGGLPVLAAVALAIWAPRLMTILSTSLYGAAGAVVGAILIVVAVRPDATGKIAAVYYYPLVAAGILLLAGMAIQLRHAPKPSLGGMEHGSSYKR